MKNLMERVELEKITLNIGMGNVGEKLDRGVNLLKNITNAKPIKTVTNKRIPTWNIRPGLPIGCKVTLRGKKAKDLLKKLLHAVNNTISERQFDNKGNLSFGIKEYIEIPDVKYDVEIGVIGLEVAVTLKKPGYRVSRRRIRKNSISRSHIVTKEEAIEYLKKEFNIEVGN